MIPAETKSLKERVLRAGGWNIAGYGLNQAIRMGTNLIMTRLLVPEMFGVMAIATMVTVTLAMLSDVGVRQNIVQSKRGNDPVFLNTAWVVQVVRGGVLWIVAVGLSVALYFAGISNLFPAQSVFASPILPLVIAVSSLSTIFAGFQSTKWATAYRHFEQKRIVQIELTAQCIGLFVMLLIAVSSRTIWALVAGGLVASFTTTVLSHIWMNGHSNHFGWSRSAFIELVNFGKWIFVSSFVGVIAGIGDRLILGTVADATTLGLYSIATLLIGALFGGFGRFFAMVSMPAVSEIARNDPSRLREIYYKMRVPIDLLLLFLTGVLYTSAQRIVDLLYDPRYAEAGAMMQILALSLFAGRYGVAQQVYLAMGITRHLAIMNIVSLVSLYTVVPALYAAYGVQGAIWGIALSSMTQIPLSFYFNHKLGLNDFRKELLVLPALPAGFVFGWALNLLWT